MKLVTKNQAFMDSGLAFFINQLTKLDPKLYVPLQAVTYPRDIMLREDVSLASESTSYILSSFGASGGQNIGTTAAGGGIPYINSGTTGLAGVSVDGQVVTTALRYAAMTLSYTKLELLKAQQAAQPLDAMKFNFINIAYQMSADQTVYVGDSAIGTTGLVNSASVTNVSTNVSNKTFALSTPNEILADFNELCKSVHTASGFAFAPHKVLVPFSCYGQLTQPISTAGSISIVEYIKANAYSTQVNGVPLEIVGVKWLEGVGAGGTQRMVAYTNDYDRVRFPMVPIQGFEPSYHDLMYSRPYVWALGGVEIVYPETIGYRDGI